MSSAEMRMNTWPLAVNNASVESRPWAGYISDFLWESLKVCITLVHLERLLSNSEGKPDLSEAPDSLSMTIHTSLEIMDE